MTVDFSDDPRGRELRLLIERAKYERWVLSETQKLVDREFNRIVDLITSSKFRDLTRFQQQRALQLFRELERQITKGYSEISDFQVRQMKDYAAFESELAQRQAMVIVQSVGVKINFSAGAFLPRYTLQSIATLPIQGLKISEWFEAQASTMGLETRRIIQQALVEGKGPLDIARKIMASDATQGPVLVRRARSEARAIARTTVTAVQNHAAQKTYQALPDKVSASYVYTAIRDSRTTAICRALDGNVYRYDDPKKKVPPQHVNCRSTTIAVLLDGNGKPIHSPKTPHSFASYNDWLKAQNTSTQNDILGPTRADLWRSGKMTLADAVDADNRVLTLAQLREKLGLTKELAGAA